MAGVVEMLIFAVVDPDSLHWFGEPLQLSREGMYTLAFFVFWGIIMASSAMTTVLSLSASEINRQSMVDSGLRK